MCGTYYIELNIDERVDIYPGSVAPIITLNGKENAVWGFPKKDSKAVIFNARSETVTNKYTFADSFYKRRCVMPCNGFYEWSHDNVKRKYSFHFDDTSNMYLGGFYKDFDGRRFVVMTTEAEGVMIPIHSRMPIILTEKDVEQWIEDQTFANSYIVSTMPNIVCT